MLAFLLLFAASALAAAPRALLDKYCVACHNAKLRTAEVSLDSQTDLAADAELGERVNARLRAGSMPPPGHPRPDVAAYRAVAAELEGAIDRRASAGVSGTLPAVHRLNRGEYRNAIRDLFALDFDVMPLLPGDETADGAFDNFAAALSFSAGHMERYMSVARQVTRLAVGIPPGSPRVDTFPISNFVLQDDRQSEDLPLGSRGGIAIRHNFPATGDYAIRVRLQRQYQDYIKGMGWPQRLDVRVDGKLVRRFTVGGRARGRPAAASYAGDGEPGYAGDPEWEIYMQTGGDAGLEVRTRVEAGPHTVGVAFVRELFEPEGLPQPLQRGRVIANDQVYMDPANVGWVQIGGPHGAAPAGEAADTPSRRAIFVCKTQDRDCAATILGRIARLAYRRPVTAADTRTLMEFFDAGRNDGGSFDSGIQFGLERVLADPDFLLRVRRGPAGSLEAASRLSFFLWSSIPDDALLRAAETGALDVAGQARRMLADPRAVTALVSNFAAQWLNLRRLEEVVVDPIRYPNYDESLLHAFRRETELFVAHNIQQDRPVAELLSANYTFANERLARHYGLAGVSGSRFRKVALPDAAQRGGLLAHGAVLATTSYPDRTSPVLRGKWLLNNVLGLPVPPPPPGLNTTLADSRPGARPASIRERLAEHRRNPSCNSCHVAIDPLGFALENFDAIGGWRTSDETGRPVDAAGTTAAGVNLQGLAGLRAALLDDREQFPRTVTEKLLAYAMGRPLQYRDLPVVRRIVRNAAARQYRWSSLILGIAQELTP